MLEPSLAEWDAHVKKPMTDLEEILETPPKYCEDLKSNGAPVKIIDASDLALYEKAKLTIHDLEVEIKTVSGFVIDVLNSKYKFESQEEFNKYFK